MDDIMKSVFDTLTNAGFINFQLTETKLNKTKYTMRTEDQKDIYIKELEKAVSDRDTRLVKAVAFFQKMKTETAPLFLKKIQDENIMLKEKLKEALLVQSPLMNIDIPEQHASDDIVEEIRLAYPKKIDKDRTITSIKKAIKESKRDGMTPEAMLKTVKSYASEMKRFGINNRHEKWNLVPAPTTFFNQKRFELQPADWTANFRDGKHTDREVAPEVKEAPKFWREVIKHMYPESDTSRSPYYHFQTNHPDVDMEMLEKYNEIVKELGLW